jgi:hypothetical protein
MKPHSKRKRKRKERGKGKKGGGRNGPESQKTEFEFLSIRERSSSLL